MNSKLIASFEKLRNHYNDIQDKGRTIAYNRAIVILKSFDERIEHISQLEGIKGIGSTIISKVNEFLQKGEIDAVNEIRQNEKKRGGEQKSNNVIDEFEKIWGVGPVKAKKLFEEHKTTSIHELKQRTELLTDQQRIGLKYFNELQMKVPRKIIKKFENILNDVFENCDIKIKITGSYRRGKNESGDVDCVICSKQLSLEQCVAMLTHKKVIIDNLSMRNEKFMGVGKIDDCIFRLDIEFVDKQSYGSAVLYFTGSKEFNISMRSEAKRQGYLLNEHGLFENGKNVLDCPSEKDIFEKLKMKYVKPENR